MNAVKMKDLISLDDIWEHMIRVGLDGDGVCVASGCHPFTRLKKAFILKRGRDRDYTDCVYDMAHYTFKSLFMEKCGECRFDDLRDAGPFRSFYAGKLFIADLYVNLAWMIGYDIEEIHDFISDSYMPDGVRMYFDRLYMGVRPW